MKKANVIGSRIVVDILVAVCILSLDFKKTVYTAFL